MEHIRIIITGLALVCAVGLLAACDQGKDQETTAETALATHPITESAELTESSTETPTEAPTAALTEEITEAPTEEIESHRPTREDWDENDPENPYYNLIQIGTYVWVIKDTYGLTPGYYKMVENDDPESEQYYGYDLVATLEEWPGLPNGKILPD